MLIKVQKSWFVVLRLPPINYFVLYLLLGPPLLLPHCHRHTSFHTASHHRTPPHDLASMPAIVALLLFHVATVDRCHRHTSFHTASNYSSSSKLLHSLSASYAITAPILISHHRAFFPTTSHYCASPRSPYM